MRHTRRLVHNYYKEVCFSGCFNNWPQNEDDGSINKVNWFWTFGDILPHTHCSYEFALAGCSTKWNLAIQKVVRVAQQLNLFLKLPRCIGVTDGGMRGTRAPTFTFYSKGGKWRGRFAPHSQKQSYALATMQCSQILDGHEMPATIA